MGNAGQITADEIASVIVDNKRYAERTPVEAAFSWLRANEPIARIKADGYNPFWALTRHADILEASRRNSEFINGDRPVILCDSGAEERSAEANSGFRTLVTMDAPDHLRYRAVTQNWFMPKNLRGREDNIRVAARRSVDRLLANGSHVDIVEDLTSSYPLHIIMDILGVPIEDEEQMLEWAKQLIAAQDPDMRRQIENDPTGQAAYAAVVGDLMRYFGALTYERRENPRDDVASIIANSQVNGAQIADVDALGYYIIIATAGHDTTAASSAGAIRELAQDPVLLQRVKADPSLIPALVDEAIRYVTPVQHFMRTAATDLEIGGQTMAKGDWVMLPYLSGNRDEAVFEAPERFNIDRSPNRHLSFGYGAHLCLGQHLAKMEMRVLLEELLPKLASIEPAGQTSLVASTFVSGAKTLPVKITAA